MAAPVVTAKALTLDPSAANGPSITPSSTDWGNSSWVEHTASTPEDRLVVAISMSTPATTPAMWIDSEFEVDVGVGGAGSEVVKATVASFSDKHGFSTLLLNIPLNIPSGSRIALRLRKEGTSTTAVVFKLIYISDPEAALPSVSDGITCVPTAALGVSLTPSGTAWANSAWAELSSSLSDIVLLGLSIDPNGSNEDAMLYELEIGKGGAGSEIVVATSAGGMRFWESFGINEGLLLFRVPVVVDGSNRIAIRLRKGGTSTTALRWKLVYGSAVGFSSYNVEFTEQPQKMTSNAANLPTVATSSTTWANTSYGELSASTPAGIVLTALEIGGAPGQGVSNRPSVEMDVATGGAGSEAVVTRITDTRNNVDPRAPSHVPIMIPMDNIPSGTRVAARIRHQHNGAITYRVGAAYYEKPL